MWLHSEDPCRLLPSPKSTQSSCHRLIPRAFITPGCPSVLAAKVANKSLKLHSEGAHTADRGGQRREPTNRTETAQRQSENLDKGCHKFRELSWQPPIFERSEMNLSVVARLADLVRLSIAGFAVPPIYMLKLHPLCYQWLDNCVSADWKCFR